MKRISAERRERGGNESAMTEKEKMQRQMNRASAAMQAGRRCGLGSRIVEAAVDTAKTKLHADTITIEAQTYARALYERCGFHQTSEEFLEDGIPHIQMQLKL